MRSSRPAWTVSAEPTIGRASASSTVAQHRDRPRQREPPGVLVVLTDDDPGGDDRARRVEQLGWLEPRAVELELRVLIPPM